MCAVPHPRAVAVEDAVLVEVLAALAEVDEGRPIPMLPAPPWALVKAAPVPPNCRAVAAVAAPPIRVCLSSPAVGAAVEEAVVEVSAGSPRRAASSSPALTWCG